MRSRVRKIRCGTSHYVEMGLFQVTSLVCKGVLFPCRTLMICLFMYSVVLYFTLTPTPGTSSVIRFVTRVVHTYTLVFTFVKDTFV